MYSYMISDFYLNMHFYVYQNNTLEYRLYLSSYDMHELIMDYIGHIYLHWNNVMFITYIYLCIRFKILLAAFCTSIPCFYNDILSLYEFCMTFVYYFISYI